MPTRSSSLGNNVSTAVDREIGSQYDDVRIVAENIESVVTVADHIENVDTVATNIVDVHAVGGSIVDVRTVATNINSVIAVEQDIVNIDIVAAHVDSVDAIVTDVIPNMTEIVNASANAAIATTKAQEASVSAAAALVSEQNAKASELAAGVSEDNAAASEVVAVTKAGEASASATAARNSELAAAAMLDAFDDRYLGSFTVDPTTDNDGQPLLDGALYFNTSENALKVYDVGTTTWYIIPQTLLSSLLDVQLTSVATGDILNWNGTKWVNTSSVREHIADTSNPHSVTKAQVELGNVDNTADVDKNVLSATKWTTARTISSTGDVTWETTLDGSVDVTGVATLANSGIVAGTYNNSATAVKPLIVDAKGRITDVGLDVTITPAWSSVTSTPTTISGYGITDAYTKTEVQTVLPKVGFDITNVTPPSIGQMAWNQDEKTVDVGINGVTLQLGQEIMTMVRNNTASMITQGTVCMGIGTIGASGRITVVPADMSNPANAFKVLGVTTEDIAPGADGFVTSFGKIRTLDTSAWNEGDILYVSNSVAGALTNVEPLVGVKQMIARVINKHASAGTIMVRAVPFDQNAYEPKNTNIQAHISSTSNPHNVTKTQVGLGNVDNTSDINKPISTATQNALDLKAPLASPALTGTPTAPTATVGDSSTQLATTAFVNAEIADYTYSKTEIDTKLAAQNDASEISVTPSGNLASTNVQTALEELQGDIDIRYTKTETDTLLAGKVDDSEIASVNLLRADKYLASQNIANMTYVSGDLAKIQYNTATDVDYEALGYTSGNLTSINHYVGSVLKGTTTLSYTAGNLTSAVFVGV